MTFVPPLMDNIDIKTDAHRRPACRRCNSPLVEETARPARIYRDSVGTIVHEHQRMLVCPKRRSLFKFIFIRHERRAFHDEFMEISLDRKPMDIAL
jgi:hypothetical protein